MLEYFTAIFPLFIIGVEAQPPIKVEGQPFGIAYDPVNKRMYVTNYLRDVSVIDTTTNTVIGNPITVGDEPEGIAYDPVNKRIYVTNVGDDTVSVIDTTTNTVIGNSIKVGDETKRYSV